ncbi:hypothetical protein IL252_16380 [Halomicrobium sp. IBSBa]|uniref:hypothetical protein n=1 Tax=Halomicrobium sp. IBSBa TaxID=2778916 RepID=UPI001ABF9A82|nr:hypothetical protein [Halomicrobium sp. IBSBa]MBO4249389.1 hypothetical protein [Halomicrobium sp. IBSBa]
MSDTVIVPGAFGPLFVAAVSALAVGLVWRYGRASLAARPASTQRTAPSSRDSASADPTVVSEP